MADLLSVAFWLDFINILFPLIIALAALYSYFTVEKDNDKLFLGIGFLFLVIAGLLGAFFADESITDLLNEDEVIYFYTIFYFLGYLIILLMVKPWQLIKELIAK